MSSPRRKNPKVNNLGSDSNRIPPLLLWVLEEGGKTEVKGLFRGMMRLEMKSGNDVRNV
ncbi:hypothetical protein AVEN_271291-1, partial [Araneus ventricosus]